MQHLIQRLRDNIRAVYLGSPAAVDRVICCLLAKGHILIEDVPGVGKTVLATALARSIDCTFARIQLTPDLLPSDILGVTIYSPHAARAHDAAHSNGAPTAPHETPPLRDQHHPPHAGFEFKRGPIFANVVLADEINRTPPRTQTALLEAMAETTVTIDGRQHQLDRPFMIIATQNPYDFEGTYLLPENQLDRFFMRINLGYPSAEDESRVLALRPADTTLHTLRPVLNAGEVLDLQRQVDRVRLDQALVDYIIALAGATRRHPDLHVGLSPRGSLALAQAARATAALDGRDYAIPEDIITNVIPVCAHRVISKSYSPLNASAAAAADYPPESPHAILTAILEELDSPA